MAPAGEVDGVSFHELVDHLQIRCCRVRVRVMVRARVMVRVMVRVEVMVMAMTMVMAKVRGWVTGPGI